MGCFLGCFGVPKDRSRRKPIKRIPSRDHRVPDQCKLLQQNSIPMPLQQPQRSSPLRLRLPTGEEERPGSLLEARDTNEEWVATPKQQPPTPIPESGSRSEKQNSGTPRKRVTFDLNVKTYEREPEHDVSEDVAEEQDHREKSQRVGVSTPGSSEAFPSNHRYQNCTISDSEDSGEDGEDEFSDDDGEEDNDSGDCGLEDADVVDAVRGINEEDESFESYFSPTIEKKRQDYKESSSEQPIESGHGARDRSRYVHSVLNPVENLSQWKEAKAKTQPLNSRLPKKENVCLGTKNEVLVEASLSNWLPSSEFSPVKGLRGNNSCRTESKVILHGRTILDAFSN